MTPWIIGGGAVVLGTGIYYGLKKLMAPKAPSDPKADAYQKGYAAGAADAISDTSGGKLASPRPVLNAYTDAALQASYVAGYTAGYSARYSAVKKTTTESTGSGSGGSTGSKAATKDDAYDAGSKQGSKDGKSDGDAGYADSWDVSIASSANKTRASASGFPADWNRGYHDGYAAAWVAASTAYDIAKKMTSADEGSGFFSGFGDYTWMSGLGGRPHPKRAPAVSKLPKSPAPGVSGVDDREGSRDGRGGTI